MDIPYVRNPRSLKLMAKEIIKITDDYWQGKTSETTLREYIHYVADNTKFLADNGKDINVTVRLAIGKKRTELVLRMLNNYQLRLL